MLGIYFVVTKQYTKYRNFCICVFCIIGIKYIFGFEVGVGIGILYQLYKIHKTQNSTFYVCVFCVCVFCVVGIKYIFGCWSWDWGVVSTTQNTQNTKYTIFVFVYLGFWKLALGFCANYTKYTKHKIKIFVFVYFV